MTDFSDDQFPDDFVAYGIPRGSIPPAALTSFRAANARAGVLQGEAGLDVPVDEFADLFYDVRTQDATKQAIEATRNLRALQATLQVRAAAAEPEDAASIERELASIDGKLQRLGALIDADADSQKPQPRKVRGDRIRRSELHIEDSRRDFTPVSGRRTAAQLFGQAAVQQSYGFKGWSDYLRAALGTQSDPRLQLFNSSTDQSEGTGSDGGFYVPEPLLASIIDSSLETEVVRPRCRVVPMSSVSVAIPWIDDCDRTGAHASGEWLAELGTATNQVEHPTLLTLRAHRCAIYGNASLELMQDAPNFASDLEAQLSRRLGFTLDDVCINGNGVGKPLGFMNAPCLITVAKESSPAQAADTIVFENIVNMSARLAPACWPTAVWLASPTTLPQLFAIQNKVWNAAHTDYVGGSAVPVFSESNGTFRLLGRELLISEKMAALGDLGDIALCDFSKYLLGMRLQASLERNLAPGWQTYSQAFRLVVRLDGRPAWSKVITPSHGATMSCFVTLASRA